MARGPINIITGHGKGKTTTALGLGMKAVAQGRKVLMIQFLKGPDSSGEHAAAGTMEPEFTLRAMGRVGFLSRQGGDDLDRVLAQEAIKAASEAMLTNGYDMVILDEINVAVSLGLVPAEELLAFIENKPEKVELVLTGRYARAEVIDRADSVLEMHKVKHPSDTGIPAQEGIEF